MNRPVSIGLLPIYSIDFLKLFMDAHDGKRMQLIFTTHEDTIMDQDLFRRDEIWFVERDNENSSHVYSFDRFKERYDKKLSKAYLEGRYGAIDYYGASDHCGRSSAHLGRALAHLM